MAFFLVQYFMFTTIDKFYFLPKIRRIIFAHATPRIPVSTVDAGSVKSSTILELQTLDKHVENGISKPSSNPGQDSLCSLCTSIPEKDINLYLPSTQTMDKIARQTGLCSIGQKPIQKENTESQTRSTIQYILPTKGKNRKKVRSRTLNPTFYKPTY